MLLRFLAATSTEKLHNPDRRPLVTRRPFWTQASPILREVASFNHQETTLSIAASVTLVVSLFQVAFNYRATPPRRVLSPEQAASLLQMVSRRRRRRPHLTWDKTSTHDCTLRHSSADISPLK